MKKMRFLASLRMTAALLILLISGQQAYAATHWSVEYTGGKFVISRDNTTAAETVNYRTVSISALAGKHFTGVENSLSFSPGESSKQISVSETAFSSVPLRYRYQGSNKLYYDFVITDNGGNILASMRKEISSGAESNNQYYLNNFSDFVNPAVYNFAYFSQGVSHSAGLHYDDVSYTPPTSDVVASGTYKGYVMIDDSYDYRYKSATVSPSHLFAVNRAGATGEWHKLVGNKLYASVVFTEIEQYDGYAYVQILIGDGNSAYDEGYDPDGAVDKPVNSIYKACFELKLGSPAYDGTGKWIFPHSLDCHDRGGETGMKDWTAFWLNDSYLWQQRFRSQSYRSDEGNNAFVLDPDIPALTVRFDCGGSGDDTFGYKDLFVRWGLVDDTAPTVLKSEIAISPGLHLKGKQVTVSIPFSEPMRVEYENFHTLHTSWGDFQAENYYCNGRNVISFTGTITADEGTPLTLNSIETTLRPLYPDSNINPLSDLVGNPFGGDVSKTFANMTVDGLYDISYNLGGGTLSVANPSQYSNRSSAITLNNPTREHYSFTGWTGTGLEGPTMTVTIPAGSTGDRSYTATWAPQVSGYWTGDGSEANPYIISTAEGLDHLAVLVNAGDNFLNTYFELGADIDLSGISPFRGIGHYSNSKPFSGKFDGKGFTIKNVTLTSASKEIASGLFHYIRGGYVHNLTVANATVNASNYMGVIVGYANYDYSQYPQILNCTVKDCTLNGLNSAYDHMGGIAGEAKGCTISGCVVDNCSLITNASVNELHIGGLVGTVGLSCSITNNVVAHCTISGTGNNVTRKGAAIGSLYGTTPSNLFVLDATMDSGAIFFGSTSYTGTSNGLHYHQVTCGDTDPVSDVYSISASAGIVVSGTAAASYAGKSFFSFNTEITVSAAPGFTLNSVYFTPAGGSETAASHNGNGTWSFPMASGNVSVHSSEVHVPLTQGTKENFSARWSTFYNGTTNHTLMGATAYTMGANHKLYRLGTDGLTIPKGVAVIIIATSADATISPAGTANLNITDHSGGNILRGSDSSVAVSGLSGTPYVLSVSGSAIGFRRFTGTSIPAGKAYYVVTP